MKTFEIEFFENGHKYRATIHADSIEHAIDIADFICEIPSGNITSIKEVK